MVTTAGLGINETSDFIFNVTADIDTTDGTPALVLNDLAGGLSNQYTAQKEFTVIIGFVPEYCLAGSSNTSDEFIQQVLFNTIDNSSTQGPAYSDYTDISTDITREGSYDITIINGEDWDGDQMGCWIDWNYDGDFDDADEQFAITYTSDVPSSGLGTGTGTITVPATARLGATTMRLRVMYTGSLAPCGDASYGEVEDYTVNVISFTCPSPSNLTANNITANSAEFSWTAGGTETLWNIEYGLQGYTQGTGTQVNEVNNPYTQSGLDDSTSYDLYVQADCGEGDISGWAGPYSFTTENNIGINENIVDNYVKMYPNPTNGNVQITNTGVISVAVYNVLGEQLVNHSFAKGNNNIDLSNYSNGVYFVKVSLDDDTNQATKTYRLIKK